MVAGGIIQSEDKPLMSGGLNKEIFFSFNKYFIEDLLYDLTQRYSFERSDAIKDWPPEAREAFFWGDGDNSGLIEELERLFHETKSVEVQKKSA